MLLLLLLLTGVVGIVVIYIASMNRREISNKCVLCCERMTYKSIHINFRKIKKSKRRPCFTVGQFIVILQNGGLDCTSKCIPEMYCIPTN